MVTHTCPPCSAWAEHLTFTFFCISFRLFPTFGLLYQFVMSVATEEGCRMATETFGIINYLASATVEVNIY